MASRLPLLSVSQSPAWAMAMTYVAMADSLGLAMQNAVANQQRGQLIANAAATRILALIIQSGST
ncbi:RebB family R body protein [Burkholderia gladioli]|uniref:RebB family R body protein n=1 Tax=Burkholderia gladioli TaxID=28095 RepID=UPI0005C94927|nr:RebB family R body protein [Burkholderia gladioli]